MPAPRLTPAQKTFGIGLLPAFEFFRPPEGMEFDPAYSNFTRQQQELAAESQLQRQAFQQQRDELRRNQEVLAAEDKAIAAMKERPDEIPNILRSFPELARSRNLGGVLNYAQAVTPTAGQKTLAPSLRMKLDPSELRHFDEAFNQTGDALSAYDQARLKGENERGFAEMLGKGVPLEVAMQHKDKILTPFERAALVQQHANKGKEEDANEFSRKKALDYLFTNGNYDLTKPEEFTRMQADVANVHKLFPTMRSTAGQPQPPAIATPAAEGGNVAPPPVVDDGTSRLKEIIGAKAYNYKKSPEDDIKDLEAALKAPAPEGMLPLEIEAQRKKVREQLTEAKDKLSVNKVANEIVAPVWNDDKLEVESAVEDYAKRMGYPVSSVWNAVATNKPLPVLNQDVSFGEDSPYDLDAESGMIVGNPRDVILGGMAKQVNPKFKKALGKLRAAHSETAPIGTFLSSVFGDEFTPPTKAQVLEEYAKEKAKPVASAAPAVNVASPEWKPGQSVAVPGGGTITRNK